ncbi:MAG: matrixin family metalloprotease [Nanoarchaeota archaeon]|nr:matrixin family metalloprotease [Nanoarchaeota archaeon]
MGKLVALIFILLAVLGALAFSIGWLIDEVQVKDPIELTSNIENYEPVQVIDYGATPVFSEKLRFNHNKLSFFIDPSCSQKRETSMREAFQIFEDTMGIISFYGMGDDSADIVVECSDTYIELGENLFAAGEGGPTNITNTSNFKTIQKGMIFLYEDQRCDRPVVEIHELGHVLGFDHTSDPTNIMYNISRCDQKISQDMIDLINELYSIKPLPDARISELTAVKRGKYLDFNITVLNEGLLEIGDISLTLLSNDKIIDTISLDGIGIGFGRTLRATNLEMFSSKIDTIDFIIDYEDEVEELDEDNNLVQMTVGTA